MQKIAKPSSFSCDSAGFFPTLFDWQVFRMPWIWIAIWSAFLEGFVCLQYDTYSLWMCDSVVYRVIIACNFHVSTSSLPFICHACDKKMPYACTSMWEGVKTYKTYMALGLKNNRPTKTYILGSHKTTLFSLPSVLHNKGLNCSKQGDFSCRQNDGLIQY